MSRPVGLVIPAFRPNADALRAYVLDLADRLDPCVIRIELDEPTDDVLDVLGSLPVTVNAVDARRGKGAAITAGFCALDAETEIDTDANVDVYAFVDADGSTAVESVAAIVDRVCDGETDLAVGSRRRSESDVKNTQSVRRERLGDWFAWLARRLLPVSLSDYQCGAKAITATAWSDVCPHLHESGFAWDVELIAVADAFGYRIDEIPVTWADAPESTVSSVATPLELTRGAVSARHRAKQLRGDRLHVALGRRNSQPTVVERLGIDVERPRRRNDD